MWRLHINVEATGLVRFETRLGCHDLLEIVENNLFSQLNLWKFSIVVINNSRVSTDLETMSNPLTRIALYRAGFSKRFDSKF